jgi:hypothetical protein
MKALALLTPFLLPVALLVNYRGSYALSCL